MLYAIVAVLAIIIDQVVKYWVTNNITTSGVKVIINGVISLVNVHNDGAAFSFLAGGGARIYFIIITGIFVVAVILALATRFISGSLGRWSLVLVAAGGLSNCIDRIIYGYVVDMFRIDMFDFAVFNVADIFITVFCLIFVIHILFGGEKQLDGDNDDDDFDDGEDEDDFEDERRFGRKKKPSEKSRKGKQSKYEDEYEEYRSSRSSQRGKSERTPERGVPERRRPQEPEEPTDISETRRPAAPARRAAPAETADPFAEWERANARVGAQQHSGYASRAMSTSAANAQPAKSEQAVRPAQPVRAAEPPVRTAQPAVRPAAPERSRSESAPQPVQRPAAPAQQPVQKRPAGSDFDLDDILNEFK